MPLARSFDRALLFACALLCVLGVGLFPAGAFGADVVARDAFSTTVAEGGGKLTTSLSPVAANFQDEAGAWHPIDTELEQTKSGDLAARAVDGEVRIPGSLGRPIELEHDGKGLSLRLLGASAAADADAKVTAGRRPRSAGLRTPRRRR